MEREATQIAKRERRTKSELIREALRVYLATRQWQSLQKKASLRAREMGIRSEADVENVIDKLRR
jgi:CopG family transcriptional regulator/antitoxin EndoAI